MKVSRKLKKLGENFVEDKNAILKWKTYCESEREFEKAKLKWEKVRREWEEWAEEKWEKLEKKGGEEK